MRCLGMAVLVREFPGDPSRRSVEEHYHVMDVAMDARRYAGYARRHRGQENTLDHVLDARFGEDACAARAGSAISNLTLPGKVALNVVGRRGKKSTRAFMTDFMMDADLFLPFLYERVPVGVAEGRAEPQVNRTNWHSRRALARGAPSPTRSPPSHP